MEPAPSRPPPSVAASPQPFWFGLERKWWVLATMGVGTFMSALNSSIVNAITPVLMRELAIDLGTAEWITMVFLVLVSGLLPTFGRLGDLLGHKRVALVGFAVFVVAAIGCGLARTAPVLIAMRAVQAIGSAMLFATSPAILTRTFPPQQRGQALGMQGTFTYLGLMVGPALGGWLTEHAGWPAIFLASVPIGLTALALTAAVVPPEPAAGKREPFDVPGAATFLIGLSALLLALSHGQGWGWTSARVLGLLACALVALGAFGLIERRSRAPMLDLSLFRDRVILAATSSALLNYVCVYSVMFLVPFYLHSFRGLSPRDFGLLLSAQALTMALVAPLAGTLSDRIGARAPASIGMAIVTIGLVLLATLDASSSHLSIGLRLAFLGVGSGLFAAPNNSALMGAAPRGRQGVAAAVLACARNAGMVFGVAISGAVFARVLAAHGGTLDGGGFLGAYRAALLVVAGFGAVAIVTSLTRPAARARGAHGG